MRPSARKYTGTTATVGAVSRALGRQGGRRPNMRSDAPAWPNNNEAMRPLNYEVMFDVEDHHWWFVGRRAIVFSQIEDALGASLPEGAEGAPRDLRVLDIGCGAGATMDHLKRY